MAYIVTTDGHVKRIPGPGLRKLTRKEMQEAVGGDIEVMFFRHHRGEDIQCGAVSISIGEGTVMIVNGDGHVKGLPLNAIGSLLYGADVHGETIAGDIVLAEYPAEVD